MFSIALALLTPEAAACGGFFCNQIDPVEQEGEAIVFEVSTESNQTTMHVQVSYQGPPAEFAWVVPVQGTPDLFVSNDRLFSALDQVTRPQFYMYYESEGECTIWDFMMEADGGVDPSLPAPPADGGVDVLAQQQVGPYDTVVLAADNTEVLISWLQEHQYAVPNNLAPTLAPYVAGGHNFVALRLSSGQDTGDLVPLGMRYDGLEPAIPIQLTSVAATPDMQLVTYVLGDSRAIPANYLHVELNETAINWFDGGSNYMDVLSRAADEAGGHAFATEFSNTTTPFRDVFYAPEWANLGLADSTGPEDFIIRVQGSGIPANTALMDLFLEFLPVPKGYEARDYYNCPSCYPEVSAQITGFDAVAAAAAVQSRIIEPLQAIDAMFERAGHLTRLGSTMSPAEMTVDPRFAFNADLPQAVSNIHESSLAYLCEEGTEDDAWSTAPKELRMPNGFVVRIPSNNDLQAMGLSESEYLAQLLDQPAARRIERLGSVGQADVLVDRTPNIVQAIDDLNERGMDVVGGRGCTTSGTTGLALWGLALLPLFGRRRQS